MQSRRRQFIVFLTLALQLLAPLSAYASARPEIGAGDFCSAYGKSIAAQAAGVHLPVNLPAGHALEHCPLCLGGSAAVALPAARQVFAVRANALPAIDLAAFDRVTSVNAVALPFPRAPPRVD